MVFPNQPLDLKLEREIERASKFVRGCFKSLLHPASLLLLYILKHFCESTKFTRGNTFERSAVTSVLVLSERNFRVQVALIITE